MATPKDGLYRGVPMSEYEAWDLANHSVLKHMDRSPMHARYAKTVPREPTEALEMGDALHAAALEPERFEREYVEAPCPGRRAKKDRDAWAALQAKHPGANILKPEAYARILAMRDALHRHPIMAPMFKTARELGTVEFSMVWTDPESGVRCKGRLDMLTRLRKWPAIADVKTTTNASLEAFSKACANFSYHTQAAFYLDGMTWAGAPADRRFIFLTVEKDPPHGTYVHELGEADLEVARIKLRRWLRKWAECSENDEWPGYPVEIGHAALPGWAMRWEDDEQEA